MIPVLDHDFGKVGEDVGIQVTLIPGCRGDEIAATWSALECRLEPARITTTWDWVSSWLDIYEDCVAHWFAVATLRDEPIGIALLVCSGPRPMRERGAGIFHIGTAGEPIGHGIGAEYNDVLVAREHRDAFAHALLLAIRRHLHPITIHLTAFAPEDAGAFLNANQLFRTQNLRSPVFDLNKAREQQISPLALLRPSVRSRVRRSTKALQPLTIEWATTFSQATDIFDELILLHEDRWKRAGRQGAFSSARFLAFHRSLIAKLFPRGDVILFRVRHEDRTVGCLYSFVERGSVLFYQSGFPLFDDNKVKPGLTTHMLCIEECIKRGLNTYDFLAGDHRYKDELATSERSLISARAPAHAFLGPVLDCAFSPRLMKQLRVINGWRERILVSCSSTE